METRLDEHDGHQSRRQPGAERRGKPVLAILAIDDGASARRECRRWAAGADGDADHVRPAASLAAVLAVFFLLPPKYNVTMRVRVVAKQGGPDDIEFPIFKANMEALVRDPLVLSNALNDKTADGREIKDLELVRSK